MHRIEVLTKDSIDFFGEGLISKIPIKVYNIGDDSLTIGELKKISDILGDPIVDEVFINKPILRDIPKNSSVVEVSLKPAVNDPEGEQTKDLVGRVLGREIGPISVSKQYLWNGELVPEDFLGLKKRLGNPVINKFTRVDSDDWDSQVGIKFDFPIVDLPQPEPFTYELTKDGLTLDAKTSDGDLMTISNERYVALNLAEMRSIRSLFSDPNPDFVRERKLRGLELKATDNEVEITGQKWSEHCVHKKLKGKWLYTSDDPNDESGLPSIVDNVFDSIIVNATRKIMEERDDIVSVYEDNSGGFWLNERYLIFIKFETHNHPCAIDGFGGADTGVGGILRDVHETGITTRVTSNRYGFRTAHPDSFKDLPYGIQSPSRTLETMVSGVEDYGNKMGIPTSSGHVMIDDCWLKPTCFVGAESVVKAKVNGRKTHIKNIRPDYIALSLGGKVGKDGIHGATGSSDSLSADAETKEQVNQSVQIGNPIVEKKMFEVMDILRERGYIEAAQDCGAGGWNSAVGEMGDLLHNLEKKRLQIKSIFNEKGVTISSPVDKRFDVIAREIDIYRKASPFYERLRDEIISGEIFLEDTNGKGGVVMNLTHAPEKYMGLTGWEKTISEAQERAVIVIKPENLEDVMGICEHYNVKSTEVARFGNSGFYEVIDQDRTIAFLPIDFLTQGLPQMQIKAHWKPSDNEEPDIPEKDDLTAIALEMLERPNIQGYDWIVERYDHEVQGGSLIKPLVGRGRGKNDAPAHRPILGEEEIVIESWGSNPWQGDIDTYHMGRNNVVDAIGRTVAVGGNLEKIAYNGNTTCPKPENDPLVAAKVLRMLQGSAHAEIAFLTPRISGKDTTSMERSYMSTETGKEVHVKAKPELLISSTAVVPCDTNLVTSDLKLPGDRIYIVGETRDELGGSEYYMMCGYTGKNVPKSDFSKLKPRFNDVSKANGECIIHSGQYLAKGGLWAAIANSAKGGNLGVNVDISDIGDLERADKLLFSETTGRFIVTVHESNKGRFEELMKDRYVKEIGEVIADDKVNVVYNGRNVIMTNVNEIREYNKGEIRY